MKKILTEKLHALRAVQDLLEALAPIIEKERQLRREIAEELLGQVPAEGTHKVAVDGVPLKIKVPYYRSVDPAAADVVRRQLLEDGLPDVFEVKPSLRVGEYRKLPEPYRALVDSAVTLKPGLPVVEFVED